MWSCTFKDKKVVINKEVQYFDANGYNSFKDDVELVGKDGNVLRSAIVSN
ncbi:MAG: hypothetical protein K2L64_01865 [Ureaplasma sp.]|nr:hypothetical protein [Ureaplasma sp.]